MNRMFAILCALCLMTPFARADGMAPRDARPAAPYRTHALSPGASYGPEGADPCQRLAGARWGADYVAGVDAYGRPVAPADLDGGRAEGTAPVVTFDLPVPRGHRKARRNGMTAGTVTVDTGTGLVELDGRPLNPEDGDRLRELCLGR